MGSKLIIILLIHCNSFKSLKKKTEMTHFSDTEEMTLF